MGRVRLVPGGAQCGGRRNAAPHWFRAAGGGLWTPPSREGTGGQTGACLFRRREHVLSGRVGVNWMARGGEGDRRTPVSENPSPPPHTHPIINTFIVQNHRTFFSFVGCVMDQIQEMRHYQWSASQRAPAFGLFRTTRKHIRRFIPRFSKSIPGVPELRVVMEGKRGEGVAKKNNPLGKKSLYMRVHCAHTNLVVGRTKPHFFLNTRDICL
uniref:Uncharacterized protein n=1 Tax=Proboscia inermis TaxID=420281 RepID=A0A7S0GL44_9STRA|mmetsp:Transcript_6146/g.6350  ORF Transcript_6146/g.6350 Transcript_6146/m.6350 type:complete len:211 (+) Transcript_6146:47-679(+)